MKWDERINDGPGLDLNMGPWISSQVLDQLTYLSKYLNWSDRHNHPPWRSPQALSPGGVKLLVPGVDHGTKCNRMGEFMMDQTRIWTWFPWISSQGLDNWAVWRTINHWGWKSGDYSLFQDNKCIQAFSTVLFYITCNQIIHGNKHFTSLFL